MSSKRRQKGKYHLLFPFSTIQTSAYWRPYSASYSGPIIPIAFMLMLKRLTHTRYVIYLILYNIVVYDRNHLFGLGPIPKPKLKIGCNFRPIPKPAKTDKSLVGKPYFLGSAIFFRVMSITKHFK